MLCDSVSYGKGWLFVLLILVELLTIDSSYYRAAMWLLL